MSDYYTPDVPVALAAVATLSNALGEMPFETDWDSGERTLYDLFAQGLTTMNQAICAWDADQKAKHS